MGSESDLYKSILDHLYDGVYFTNRDRQIIYWNHGAERITGFSSAEVLAKSCADNLLMHVNAQGVVLCRGMCPLAETIQDGQVREAEVFLHHKNGHRVPVSVRVSPIRDQTSKITGAVEVFSNNTARLAALEKIAELQRVVLIDPLTGVGNRRYTELALRAALEEFERNGLALAVLFIDIDHFKTVNDTYGHPTGDRVLKMAVNTLSHNLQPYDFIGRWGGEEFIIMLINVDRQRLQSEAEKLRALVEQSSLDHNDATIRVTISIGATMAQPGDTPESLVERADCLLYRSKSQGRNRISLFERSSAAPG